MSATASSLSATQSDRADALLLFERRFKSLLHPHARDDNAVTCALQHIVDNPGRRVRPRLMLNVASDLGLAYVDCVDVAAAVEMVHTASLIFDDLPCMDDAATRRGQPTLHRRYGEDVAMLSAIALIMLAFKTLATDVRLTSSQRVEIVAMLSTVSGIDGLITGQLRDLTGHGSKPSMEEVSTTNLLKTGTLFHAALVSIGAVGTVSPPVMHGLEECAQELGLAFQLMDDLKDDPANDGVWANKDVNQDLQKSTGARLLGTADTRRQIERHIANADEALARAPHSFPNTRDFVASLTSDFVR